MFFMITIVSTVAFCAVGTLASTKVFTKQMHLEFPAELSLFTKLKKVNDLKSNVIIQEVPALRIYTMG
ncbi:hypothetical protein [Bacillus timonensis]|uniref:hypothetical protein n=1 Tax=Bacillus timonensis TaxID=1033734 RepID=UPI0002889548|nr:hypothetical protein [Bacillus timonensis]